MAGSFQDSLYRNNAKIRKDRADSIIEDANLIYKREIEDLEVEMKKMQREQENMLDLSPTNAMNLTLASDFDSKVYVAKDLELGVKIGFNQSEWIELDDVVVFDEIKTQTSTFNARFDIWVLPFLNVYGIVGQTAKADIDVNLIEPLPLSVTTTLSGTYVGYGVLLAGGVGPLFVSLDANRTYNYNPRLDDPAKVFIGGMRVGPIFRFKNNQDMNVVIWGGAMYSHFNGETNGQINAIDLAPDAPGRIDEMQGDLNNWYDGLSPAEKILSGLCS